MTLRIIDGARVRSLLSIAECMDVMADAMVAASSGKLLAPPRLVAPLIDASGFLAVMPGSSVEPPVFGAKIVSLLPGNPSAGRPAIQGWILLFDAATGAAVALVDGAEITAIRTAAVSGLATKGLARDEVQTHGVLGTGVQARTHVEAISIARPSIREVILWGRCFSKAQRVAECVNRELGIPVRPTRDPREAAACDVVSTVTGAATPVLEGSWLKSGAHVNLVGSHKPGEREADTACVVRSSVYVDLLANALDEAGDLLIPMNEGAFRTEHIIGEIGQLVMGSVRGRRDKDEITLFKSLGAVAQDIHAAWATFRRDTAAPSG